MNNFRQYPPKSFGGRGPDLPNPWMTEEELVNIRRQNPQFHPAMPNINPNMHPPLLNQTGVLPMPNKHLMGQNSCKMLNSSFTNTPNPNIFKSPYPMEEPNYSNRFMGDRFNNSYSPMNVHSKLNDGAIYKDFPASNMMSPLSHKNDRFSSVSKPLISNVRQPQERLQCMQNDQSQFTSKYGSSPVFQGKDFPFGNLKDSPSQNSMPYNNKLPVSTGCNVPSFKANVRPPNLFPAYTPKDSCETPQKALPLSEGNVANASHSPYSSDFIGKSTFCDNSSIASSYSKTMESFHEKESYQEKNIPAEGFPQANKSQFMTDNASTFKTMSSSPVPQDSYKTVPNTEVSQESYKNVQKSQVLHDSFKTMPSSNMPQNSFKNVSNFPMSHDSYKPLPSSQISHDSYKAVPNSQVSHEAFKEFEGKVSSSNSKYPYSSENQQACFQSSSDIPFQSSESVSFSFPSTSTTDCLLQTTPFSSQSDVHQTSKETFSTFSFESNINTTDIADLLPGLDAFLKETVSKSEQSINKAEDVPKNDFAKSTVPNCALSDDEWSKHSIPLIGDNQFTSNSGNQNEGVQQSICDQVAAKEKCGKFESVFEKPGDLKSTAVDQSNSDNQDKQIQLKNITGESEASKARSALEEAIDLLVTTDPIVGLDYIIEYKKNISQQGSFPFRCQLCNSAITRPSIIDHIIGSKHRMRYLKTKDESKYEHILSLKLEKADKDLKISEAAFHLEAVYGRGHVRVNAEDTPKAFGIGTSTWKESSDGVEESVFTLDKIPIGFEALSPQHDDIDPSDFTLDSDLSQVKQDNTFNITEKEISNKPLSNEVKNEIAKLDPGVALTDLCCEPSATTRTVANSTDLDNVVKNEVSPNSESDVKQIEVSSNSGQVKRALSPDSACRAKLFKSETSDDIKQGSEAVTTEKCSDVKTEDTSSETKELSLDLLESLCQSEISTDDEASVVLKVINMLMQLLLRYKLQHLSLGKVENLMKSLQIKSPVNIEELKSLLKDNKISNKGEDTELPEAKKIVQVKPEENIELCLSHFENIESKTSQSMNIVNNSGSNPVSCAQMTQSLSGVSNITAVSRNSSLYPCSMSQTSSNVMSSSASQIANAQAANSGGLKPPPFFGWPQGNESMTNKVSYAPTQGSQSMMWTNAYQHSQPQFSQMPYYQPQNFGNTFSGTHAYHTQFSVMPQASVQMSQPPLPPPPPIPPPPPPANPPLPPSTSFLRNPPSLPPYPKNQPLPPLP